MSHHKRLLPDQPLGCNRAELTGQSVTCKCSEHTQNTTHQHRTEQTGQGRTLQDNTEGVKLLQVTGTCRPRHRTCRQATIPLAGDHNSPGSCSNRINSHIPCRATVTSSSMLQLCTVQPCAVDSFCPCSTGASSTLPIHLLPPPSQPSMHNCNLLSVFNRSAKGFLTDQPRAGVSKSSWNTQGLGMHMHTTRTGTAAQRFQDVIVAAALDRPWQQCAAACHRPNLVSQPCSQYPPQVPVGPLHSCQGRQSSATDPCVWPSSEPAAPSAIQHSPAAAFAGANASYLAPFLGSRSFWDGRNNLVVPAGAQQAAQSITSSIRSSTAAHRSQGEQTVLHNPARPLLCQGKAAHTANIGRLQATLALDSSCVAMHTKCLERMHGVASRIHTKGMHRPHTSMLSPFMRHQHTRPCRTHMGAPNSM